MHSDEKIVDSWMKNASQWAAAAVAGGYSVYTVAHRSKALGRCMKLLDEHIPFRDNVRFSLERYGVFWILLVATMALDFLTTVGFIVEHGPDREANPVVRVLIHWLGLYRGVVAGKLLQLLAVMLVAGLHRRLGNLFLILVILLNSWAVLVNQL